MTSLILTGHTVQASVRSGCLVIKDGGQIHRIERVPRRYDRIIFNGNIGLYTHEAICWMHEAGIEWVVLWRDRGIVAASANGQGDPLLWERQLTGNGHAVTRFLLSAKLGGQILNALLLRQDEAVKAIRDYQTLLNLAEGKAVTGYEGRAATAYWKAWSDVNVPWLADHLLRVPPRWLGFAGRQSLAGEALRHKNRRATDPVNAMLNYAYRVGESMCAEACYGAGLSPVLGLDGNHNRRYLRDRDGEQIRQSMALDLLEAVRPQCDRVILDLLDYGQGIVPYLKWHDFLETGAGVVRVESRELRERIISGCEEFRDEVSGVAEEVVKLL